MKRILLICVATIVMCGTTFGWSIREHATVAAIAEKHLTPKAKELMKQYLGGRPMAYYASHADFYRKDMILDIGFLPEEGKRTAVFPHTYHVDKNFKPYRELVKKGEKIRIDISSSAWPYYVPHTNQKGLYSEQTTAKIAHNTVYLQKSFLTLPVEK